MWEERAITIASDHPSAAGHFPGNPIVPGALLLDAVVAAVAGAEGVVIRGAKFLAPVRHGTALTLRWRVEAALVRFDCFAAEGLVLSGTLTLNGSA